ncbi:MAG: GNAT family N-acetyltransferase [Zestosphaera sp.]
MLDEPAQSGGFVVRDAGPGDVGKVFEIYSHALGALDEADYEWFKALIRTKSRKKRVAVVEFSGDVVGFAVVYKQGRIAFLDSIAVDEGVRGRGVGGLLLNTIENLLRREGVEVVTLSVKNWNLRALDFYLRRGYVIRGMVMILSADPCKLDPPHSEDHYIVEEIPAGRLKRLRLRPTTWWSNLIEDVHRVIYKRYLRGERAIVIKSGRRVRGVAEFSRNGRVFVNYVALSSYNATKVLTEIVHKLKAAAIKEKLKEIVIPVDASKRVLVSELIAMSFHTRETEYLLTKDLSNCDAYEVEE